jgi:hypothetical protein
MSRAGGHAQDASRANQRSMRMAKVLPNVPEGTLMSSTGELRGPAGESLPATEDPAAGDSVTAVGLGIYSRHPDSRFVSVDFTNNQIFMAASGFGSPSSAMWERSQDSFVGPRGLRYFRYRDKNWGGYLSYVGNVLVAAPDSWSDLRQWWAQDRAAPYNCGSTGFPVTCQRGWVRVWSNPDLVMSRSLSSNLAVSMAAAEGGASGVARQDINIHPVFTPIP